MAFRLLSFRAATLLALTTLAACSSKKDDPTPAAPTMGMSWAVDGGNVTASSAVAKISGNDVTIAGATSNSGGVFIDVPKAAGTYTLTSTSNESATYIVTPATGASQSYDSTSGTVIVTSSSATNIAGTFTFTGTSTSGTTTKTLTNGKFNINY